MLDSDTILKCSIFDLLLARPVRVESMGTASGLWQSLPCLSVWSPDNFSLIIFF